MVNNTVPDELAKGLFTAGNEVLRDAREVEPRAPREIGDLWGSGRVGEISTRNEIKVEVGFNIEYAARWHELSADEDKRINWTLPGSGRKYLSSKLTMFKDKYMKIIADYLSRVLR